MQITFCSCNDNINAHKLHQWHISMNNMWCVSACTSIKTTSVSPWQTNHLRLQAFNSVVLLFLVRFSATGSWHDSWSTCARDECWVPSPMLLVNHFQPASLANHSTSSGASFWCSVNLERESYPGDHFQTLQFCSLSPKTTIALLDENADKISCLFSFFLQWPIMFVISVTNMEYKHNTYILFLYTWKFWARSCNLHL